MRRRQIIAMAAAWTTLMAALLQLGLLATPAAIVIAVANVWFWIGRLSCQPVGPGVVVPSIKPRWGR